MAFFELIFLKKKKEKETTKKIKPIKNRNK